MDTKHPTHASRKKKFFVISAVAVTGLVLVLTALFLNTPQRSVASYCKAYKEEDVKLASANGESYGVRVFSHKSSNPTDFVTAFSRLEQVAPDEIRADVKILRQVFQKIEDDPSQAISASLSGLSAEESVVNWTKEQCR